MDRLIVSVVRKQGQLELQLLTIPGLYPEVIQLKDYQQDLSVQVHISRRKILVEYTIDKNYRFKVSILRVFIWRSNLTCCEVSSEPLLVYGTHECESPFPLYESLQPHSKPQYYITYNQLLYTLNHWKWDNFPGDPLKLKLNVTSLSGDLVASYETSFTDSRMQWLPASARGVRCNSTTSGYGAYVTPWYLLVYSKNSKHVYIWHYLVSKDIQALTLTRIILCEFTAQRASETTAVFVDTAHRLILLTETSLKVFTMRYFHLHSLLYCHSHGRLPLPKALLQDIALLYLAGNAD